MACETAKKVVNEGVGLIDLCGYFDDEKTQKAKKSQLLVMNPISL